MKSGDFGFHNCLYKRPCWALLWVWDYNCILSHKIREILGEVSGEDVNLINRDNTGDDNGQKQDPRFLVLSINYYLKPTR